LIASLNDELTSARQDEEQIFMRTKTECNLSHAVTKKPMQPEKTDVPPTNMHDSQLQSNGSGHCLSLAIGAASSGVINS